MAMRNCQSYVGFGIAWSLQTCFVSGRGNIFEVWGGSGPRSHGVCQLKLLSMRNWVGLLHNRRTSFHLSQPWLCMRGKMVVINKVFGNLASEQAPDDDMKSIGAMRS
jgi:hypothetical protein